MCAVFLQPHSVPPTPSWRKRAARPHTPTKNLQNATKIWRRDGIASPNQQAVKCLSHACLVSAAALTLRVGSTGNTQQYQKGSSRGKFASTGARSAVGGRGTLECWTAALSLYTSLRSRQCAMRGTVAKETKVCGTPRKCAFLPCSHLDFESAVIAWNDEFHAVS